MTVEDRATFRSVILAAEAAPYASRTGQLLNDLGHDVAGAESPEHALELLEEEQADLFVVDVSNSGRNRALLERLVDLPADIRPRELAIFSDSSDEMLRGLRSRLKPSRVHIFLKPLHMHGLLNILRKLEDQQ
jgi:CheY-like chemotaxis protein